MPELRKTVRKPILMDSVMAEELEKAAKKKNAAGIPIYMNVSDFVRQAILEKMSRKNDEK